LPGIALVVEADSRDAITALSEIQNDADVSFSAMRGGSFGVAGARLGADDKGVVGARLPLVGVPASRQKVCRRAVVADVSAEEVDEDRDAFTRLLVVE
jgi:hypothetical protein